MSATQGMTAVRDNLCDLGRMEIPRPKCTGMQFVATRGRQGFYRTIRENGAKYGLQIKPQGPRRPQLSSDLFQRPLAEENDDEAVIEEKSVAEQQHHQNTINNNFIHHNSHLKKTVAAPPPPTMTRTEVSHEYAINREILQKRYN